MAAPFLNCTIIEQRAVMFFCSQKALKHVTSIAEYSCNMMWTLHQTEKCIQMGRQI